MAFKNNYSEFYDLLYENKEYGKEADYVHDLIEQNLNGAKNTTILDLACGTGKHAFLLEKKGYIVDGSDISEDMINLAIKSGQEYDSKVNFHNYSFQESHNIESTYNVVISMFSAFNYLTDAKDVSSTLSNIYNLLDDNGIFIFDYWNGNAVVRDYSPVKVLRRKNDDGEILRVSETSLNLIEQIADVNFTCLYFKKDKKVIEFTELHKMRYFYFSELENLLKINGFKIKFRSSFMNTHSNFDPYAWNISIVAEKIKL